MFGVLRFVIQPLSLVLEKATDECLGFPRFSGHSKVQAALR